MIADIIIKPILYDLKNQQDKTMKKVVIHPNSKAISLVN